MNIEEIKEKINNNEYSLVPDKIAIGEVIKIHIKGDLNIDGYETGYLYLRPNTGIKEHEHINDIERYKLITGTLKVQGINTNLNICNIVKDACKAIYFKDGPSYDANDNDIVTVHNWGEIYRYLKSIEYDK